MNACFCNGIQNPPTWRVFLLEWVAVLRVEWVAGLVSLQVEGFDRYVWLSWGGIRTYGQSYLDGKGDVVLIYPRTDSFHQALPVFDYPKTDGLRLWVLPFCLRSRTLSFPEDALFEHVFSRRQRA
jgi:5-methylcytosine-specific restriction enzyme subunit McrC